ncbi:MAG: HNH endonuclease, partial [Alphaproteobacteria bacterium]|nr:HNH endonuclease [Alphaproteobacteria bacterium]
LKPTGSIYLHCDTTAGHYLKLIMDAIFGVQNFRNDVTWQRTSNPHNDATRYGKITDNLLYYQKTSKRTWNVVYNPITEKTKKMFRHEDKRGRYRGVMLTAESLSGGGYRYEYHGHTRLWQRPLKSMLELEKQGMIHFPKKKGGLPEQKRYLKDVKGVPLQNIWTDIEKVSGKERIGYPTQKPLALLERIIQVSSNPGDTVFDPFCGCATTCLAAEKLDRRWIGVDISKLAAKLIKSRMLNAARAKDGTQETMEKFTKGAGEIVHRTDLPTLHAQRDPCIRNKLYGVQEGVCKGCDNHFQIRHMDLDHVIPKAEGGPDSDENLQLLCSSCNRIKGKKSMEELRSRLKELKIIT